MQFFKQLTDPALKRLYKFVLKRMIGRFLAADELDLDQLDVHLRSGRLELCDLLLNAEVLNAELCEAQGLPFKVKKGYLGSVRVAISYANIMSESCLVEIDDIEIILVPLEKDEAQTRPSCTEPEEKEQKQDKQEKKPLAPEPVDEISQEGLDFVASWIEQVTSKIKVTLSNICLRLETGEQHNGRDVALLCKLQWAQFTDESAAEMQSVYGRSSLDHSAGMYGSQTMGAGVQSMAASTLFGISQKGIMFRGISMDLHLSSEEKDEEERWTERRRTEYSEMVLHPFLASDSNKQNYIKVKLSHYEALEAPAMDADVFFHSIRIVLQPQYFPELGKIVDAFSTDPVKLNGHQLDDRYTSTAMFQSICADRPAWLTGGDDGEDDDEGGALNLSFREFQRIEQLLLQYRQTQDELKTAQRRRSSTEEDTATTERRALFKTRKLSAAESVESIGLSDLDDEEDGFFECETGLASSIAPFGSLASSSKLGQSMYASARYSFDENESESRRDDRSQLTWSTTAQNRAARRVQSRVKVHLLECECVLLYDDLPDDEEEEEEEVEDSLSEREAEGSMTDSRFLRAPVRPTKPLPSVDGLERLEISLKDIIFSTLAYSQHSLLAFTIGKVAITEKTLPRMSLDAEEDESAMLSTCVLRFADTSPVSGRKVNLSANVSAQLRIGFKPASDDDTSSTISSLGVRVNAQPVLVEWDMYLLDRAHRLLALLEDDTSTSKRKAASTARAEAKELAKTFDMTTECVQMTLRFPMVNSDLIRFGPSSKRGLCEDRLVMTLESVKVVSYSPRKDDEAADKRAPMPPQYRKGTSLPWLAEFDASFDSAKVSLLTPEDGNQRSSRLEKAVLVTASSDERSGDVCTLRLRLQAPSREEMKEAVASKQNLSQDASQSPDGAYVNSSPDDVSGDDNDGGRVGLNGWNLDALGRAESYENAAAAASLYSVEIGLPHANAVLLKSSLDRLMVLFDALLMINPIDVDSYNQMLAVAALRNRLMPSYMSMNLTLGEGTVRICDYVSLPPSPSSQGANLSAVHIAEEETLDGPEKVLFTYHFAFQTLKVFQVSQWMGQLVSRVHVLAQNTTLLEEDGRSNTVVPILYKTPFGVSKAPIFFMGVDIADQTNEMREMKVELHLSHLSLRYDVRSKWLFQMLDMLLMEYPVPIIPLDSASMSDDESTKFFEMIKCGANYDAVPLATAPKTVFTKLFVNFYDVLVDYAPLTLTSRVILVLGKVSVSSNVVTGAVMQGYKISVGDLELFLTQARAGYEEIDEVLLGNDLFLRGNAKSSKRKALKFATTYAGSGSLDAEYPSLLTFLERFGFLQIVTMDFVDVFLRVLVPPTALEVASASRGQLEEKASTASASPELSVELNLGTANIYACFDSFNTLIEVLSVWTDQLAVEQEPRDTTAYVGLDGESDPSSVSVVTNLSPAPAGGMRAIGTGASEPSAQDFSSTSSVRSERFSVDDNNGGSSRGLINILEQIDEDAFGGGKKIFPGKIVATDTEARLLRTRMDSIQREKERMVHGVEYDDQFSASELRLRYQQEERRKSAKPVRINELVIENYYSQSRVLDGDESAGAFLMEPERDQDQAQGNTSGEDSWFSSAPTNPPSVDSSPDKTAMPFNEQAARWLAPGGTTSNAGDRTPRSEVDFPLFEPVEEKAAAPQPASVSPSVGQASVDYGSDNAYDLEDDDDDVDDFDANHFPMGAFPAASKNWWGMQNLPDEVELSDLQTEETASIFSHRMDLMEDRSVAHQTFSEAGMDDGHGNSVFPNAMSMSIIDVGEDQGKEIELDFGLDGDLQSRFNRILDMDSTNDQEADDLDDENDEDDENDGDQITLQQMQQDSSVTSSPRAIPTRQASFSSSRSHPGAPSSSFGIPTASPPDQPTARWFYDDQRSDDGGPPMTGPPSRIYPHHVEIPVGGSATSLSFGEKECEDAIRSIARESAARKVEATSPIVVQHVLLRNFNICMRFFGGCDWTRDASDAVSLHPSKDSHAEDTSKEKQPDSATAKKEKLLDALLDNYVPSDGGDLFVNDSSSSLFTAAKSAPTTSFMKRDPATRTTRAASSDSTPSRKRSLKKSGRKTEEMLELVVTRIQLRLDLFNEAETQSLASHTVLALGDVELLDYISTSQIRKIICYWKSEASHPRESGSSMVRLQLITVRPGPNLCEEHRLKARLLPLRINLDQEVVKFLRQFVPTEETPAPKKRLTRQISAMPDETDDEVEITMHEGGMEMKPIGEAATAVEASLSIGAWFFQSIDIKPCKIKIDYRPNHVDYAALRAGDYLEVINLFVLEGMELVLRRVQMSGLDGWAALGENVLVSWVQDISRRQIHKCVASVSMPPLRPFVNIGAGAADLILLPMEHYGRDRRLVRGIKKGASSFLKSVTIETLNTASKVAQGTQALLEHADDVVSSSSALRRKQLKYRQAGSRIARNSRRMGGGGIRNAQDAGGGIGGRQYLAQQPASAAEGFGQAYDSLARELHVAAKTIVAVPLVEYKKTGSQGYVRSVIRAVPVAVLRPMIGASEAVAKALIGVRNAVDPELKEDIENKFKDFRAI
ncbi:Autophagy-related protein C terminal domain [Phytophthora infestans]|uniref:Autophagy-related protein 2 n=1 Tax=Phytophthora infestans TaxID=4787 RepID=A0A8S9VCY9_PHYIN|nr:Autophagy-related protein C terminal domain [Phytophthora infestans]